uniref:BESS domain-containing protein n=1 Tax=Lygus hesperus TaxID=30085 RepID=A0A0A9WXE3_LYGHE
MDSSNLYSDQEWSSSYEDTNRISRSTSISPEYQVPQPSSIVPHKTSNTPSQLSLHRLKKIPVKPKENEDTNPDFLYLMSLMPYIKGMTAVQKLMLRAEFSAAVMKILSKKSPMEEFDNEAN